MWGLDGEILKCTKKMHNILQHQKLFGFNIFIQDAATGWCDVQNVAHVRLTHVLTYVIICRLLSGSSINIPSLPPIISSPKLSYHLNAPWKSLQFISHINLFILNYVSAYSLKHLCQSICDVTPPPTHTHYHHPQRRAVQKQLAPVITVCKCKLPAWALRPIC